MCSESKGVFDDLLGQFIENPSSFQIIVKTALNFTGEFFVMDKKYYAQEENLILRINIR